MSRDYAYEALSEVTSTDMNAGRGELNAALKSIREQSEVTDSYLLADEIHTRAKMYRAVMPDVMLTPSALAKHWLRVFEEADRKRGERVNQSVSVVCETCGSDRFVVVALRKPVQSQWMRERGLEPTEEMIEETAPCPDCNPKADTSHRRYDGTMAQGPDPARVRELMRR